MGMMAQLLAYTGGDFKKDLGNIVVILVSIVGALMTLYAVYIGFLFATASDANKRKTAKDRLIKVVASALIVIALAAVLGVINVNFNTVDGGHTGQSMANGGLKETHSYTYAGSVQASSVTYKQTPNGGELAGKFTIDPSKITSNGTRVTNFLLQKCTAYDCWNATFTPNGNTVSFVVVASTQHSPTVEVRCSKIENGNGIVSVTVEFTTGAGSGTMQSVNVDVVIPKTTNVNFML